jgi:hypothetical protein
MTSETLVLHSAKDVDVEQLGSALPSSEPCMSNQYSPPYPQINYNLFAIAQPMLSLLGPISPPLLQFDK